MRAVLQNRARILVFPLKSSRDSGFSSKIGRFPPNSRWLATLLGFMGCTGACSPETIRNLRSSNGWKCIQIVNPTITTLFLYHFKSFTIHQADLFGSWAPRALPLPTGLDYVFWGYCRSKSQWKAWWSHSTGSWTQNSLMTKLSFWSCEGKVQSVAILERIFFYVLF